MTSASIAVIILTYDESLHLARALDSVAGIAHEVFVVDSFSKDDTVAIAEAHGATVVRRVFDNQARQFNWALDTLDIRSDWILRLDADEIVEPDLAATILRELPRLPDDVTGVNLERKHVFLGRWIRHGGRYPVVLLRLWRRGRGRVEDRWMDEHVVVDGGRTVTFHGGFADHNLNDLTYFTEKHNRYATREAVEVLARRHGLFSSTPALEARATSRQAALKRRLKEALYNRLPFWLGPLAYYLFRMTFQLGFLDGREGLIYHFLQGFWYRFLVGAKVFEMERGLVGAADEAEKLERLRRMTGLTL